MEKKILICSLFLLLMCPSVKIFAKDWPSLNRFRFENEQLKLENSTTQRIVFMGNSITEGWLHDSLDLFKRPGYINRGISGQTTPQMLVRFRADVIDLDPAMVVILAGINDIAENTGPSTTDMILDNIKSMADLASTNGIKVVLCSVLPAADFPWNPGLGSVEKIKQLNAGIKEFAVERAHYYLDFYSTMVNQHEGLIDDYTYDGVHPNLAGYRIMTPLVLQAIENHFNQ